jgi:hypothetical protein
MRAYEGRCHVCGRDDFPDLLSTTEEIARLTKQNEKLVAALDDIASGELGINLCIKRAKTALAAAKEK